MRAARDSLVAVAAALVSFCGVYALCLAFRAGPSPAILAAALAIGSMRKPERASARRIALKFVSLPLVVLAVAGVGLILRAMPPLGALLFCVCMALPVLARNYGAQASWIARAVALPFVVMLVVPIQAQGTAPGVLVLLGICAGVAAVLVTSAASHFIEAEPGPVSVVRAPRASQRGTIPVPTRMALQMFVALALAFTIGMLLFHRHWPWVVLSAFIICGGAVGRGDAVYKALLRLGGAVAGTAIAAALAFVSFPSGVAFTAAVFAVLFAGIWLRRYNYAYWAACATLLFALLQNVQPHAGPGLFAARIGAIAAGALCAIAAVWFVFPIRTRSVVRRRVADVAHALRELLGAKDDVPHARAAVLEAHRVALDRVAPSVRLHRAVLAPFNRESAPALLLEKAQALLSEASAERFDRVRVRAKLRELANDLRPE